ncbi:beta/alpha barrel domain-containing protein [Clostridium estertheticum]|uniref:2-isopropylmalate synthase n=1 Tax=Clostridium estertheticum subsp. estertheticum TaxID=1552 RepID=A0A1J0GM81_9CLOT|nr:2-isopropylmalate synthase [Clostridium estertheticum]APC42522.1 2-isopropylmalate synthase [Clostridium estertheticum subsp. estertheticum]MBU3074669.1 2-isopropylmalate synthase [Clostridium estertheticum]MBU3164619.1 2-isopropylmalate synthase [Clostridium estertheticum]MBZ9615423.1 2-isopropylmalate synthase [Clostridium estertheticum subsp. laramiense]WAG75992.1 2-isopropylmalate synthase [Clostridium estertheticum]
MLFKEIFPYSEIPKVVFGGQQIPMSIPDDIWITDTTFRDGQQSMDTYTEKQIVKIFDYLHKLDNNSGIIRQTEFFLYTQKDRNAARKCLERGYEFPEVTSWIRANKEDFKLVKDMGLKETGMLMSCSDYHIFKKLNKTRQEAMDLYVSLVEEALENGIIPRCHLEDITRADFFGFVIPLVQRLMELSKKSGIKIKIRACDTLGLGLPYSGTELPRSVPQIISGLIKYGGVPSEYLEWHGHNDFYNVVSNATTAWLHGCSAINTSLFGIGERTGNCPLEAMIVEYGQIRGNVKNMNLKLISEIGQYFEGEFKYSIPPRTPYVGSEFNVTRAGIHADGILKDEEIYNIFDTEKILGRPIIVAVNEHSGHAGIAAWVNTYYRLKDLDKIDKKDERINVIKDWVDKQYETGRSTVMKSEELELITKKIIPQLSTKKHNAEEF